jgi:hypothetical protein
MQHIALVVRCSVTLYLGYLLWFIVFEYHPADPLGFHPPLVLWVMDVVNLFIHEAGHMFFGLFGFTISALGGSLMQCLLPFALTVVTLRERPRQVPYPLFWLGENLVNVAVYIADAQYRNLRLLREGLTHDWHWLLADHLDAAERIGAVVRWSGVAACAGAVAVLAVWLVQDVAASRRNGQT